MARQSLSVSALAALLLALLAAPARADGPYDGAWMMSAVTETFTVQDWATACGPPPVSDTLIPGGRVTVAGSGGELVIAGARTLRTDQCLDPLPTLARTVHSQDATSWRTRCATPASDPRHAVVNTAYFVTGTDAITLAETGRYEFTINDARCVADVKRAGSLARVVPAAVPPPQPTATSEATAAPPAPPPAPRVDCRSPGDPAVLQVRPSRKVLEAGGTFAFRGVVLDASGCGTGTPIQWAVGTVAFKDGQARAASPTIDASGTLTVPVQDFGDATFDVIATAAGKSARASVEVAIPADYAALLAQSGLGSSGELDTPAIAVIATSAIGAGDAKAQDGARRRKTVFVGVVGGLVTVLGVIALFGARRGRKARQAQAAAEERHAENMRDFERRKQEREAQHEVRMKAFQAGLAVAQQQAAAATARGIDTGPMACPTCRREYAAGHGFCAFDANRLVATRGHEELLRGPAGMVCPACRKGQNPGVKVCPTDGEALLPVAAAGVGPTADTRGKICPACGARPGGGAVFCSRDGTALVLVN